MPAYPKVILKKGKERPILRGHPWVFSGAVARIEGDLSSGEVGEICSAGGQFLGLGYFNPRSQILLRLLTREKEELSPDFFVERMTHAGALRKRWLERKACACRLINGEGDFLPGLIVDRYGETLVLQCLTAGMERWKTLLVDLLVRVFHPVSIYERSDVPARKEEGLPDLTGLLHGRDVPNDVEIEEDGCLFHVDVRKGQKTGFYLDQRENRAVLKDLSNGKKVLDCFSYTGAFSIHAGWGGAREIVVVDSSGEALEKAEEHFKINRFENLPHRLIRGDAFDVMRNLGEEFDLIILDPPPFAKKKSHLSKASRGYKDLNLQAFRLLKKEGLLLTFSCSHHMGLDLFQKIVFSAAVDAGRKVQIISRRGHPVDHPIHLSHPEGEYLKGLICRVL
jgi:23S rRNA (cytosine1962-C5)-methyltransferase